MNRLVKYVLILSFAMALLLLVGCEGKTQEETDIQYTAIMVEPVSVETIETVFESTGRIEARNSVKVTPEIPGELAAIHVTIGQNVKTGQVLMSIQSTELLAQAELALKQANSQWLLAKEQADKNNKKLEDVSKLYASGAVSQDAYDDMKLLHKESTQSLKIAEESLRVAQVSKRQVHKKFNIISPIEGKVINLNGTVGSTDLSDVYVLVQGDKGYEVNIPVPENTIESISLNTRGHASVVSSREKYDGQVIKVSEEMDMNLGLYKVSMMLTSDDGIIPGQFVKTQLLLKEEKNQLMIPSLAVRLEETKKYVYTYNENILKKVEVTTGAYQNDKVQILTGLNKEDIVVVKGQSFITADSLVKVINSK